MQSISTSTTKTEPISDLDLPHAVIRFKRRVELPRFTMDAGERWGFVVFGKYKELIEQIKRGERFDFAGGQVLANDVEVIYEGDCGLEYSIASGNIRDPEMIEILRSHRGKNLKVDQDFTVKVTVTGDPSCVEDESVPGEYSFQVRLTTKINLMAISVSEASEIAKAVLDCFHEKFGIASLDDFKISVFLPNGKEIMDSVIARTELIFSVDYQG